MTTLEETDAAPAAPDSTHLQAATAGKAAAEAAVSADGELDPELTTDFHVDPAYTTTSKQPEEEEEQAEAAGKDRIQSLKSVVIISGVVVAVIGALIAVAKKIKEA